jgi:hypothetical protein
MQQTHPSHAVITAPPGPQWIKETLHSKCINLVEPYLTDGVMLEINYRKAISSLHTAAVAKSVCEAGPNPVLGLYPPSVNPEEETLTRAHRCTLRQLHSGYCHQLQTYLYSIGKAVNDLCLECRAASHMTAHLFQCLKLPTNLTLADLWYKPHDAAIFL